MSKDNQPATQPGISDYRQQIENYARKIRSTTDITEIISILDVALRETKGLETNHEIQTAQAQVQQAERKIEVLISDLEDLRKLAHADQLTGALNRRGLDDAFTRESARADRNRGYLCVAMIDLDNFKKLNDTQGHQAGDAILAHLVSLAKKVLRPSDTIARFGGEEFILLLPDTSLHSAMSVMHRLQQNLASNPLIYNGQPLPITFSGGLAVRKQNESQNTVIERADKALYSAKHAGKNRVLPAA